MSKEEVNTKSENEQKEGNNDDLFNHSMVFNYDSFSSSIFTLTLVCFLFSSVFLGYHSMSMIFSNRATVVDLPYSVGVKPAYVLNNFSKSEAQTKSNTIKRFVRDTLLLMTPRNAEDAKIFYDKLAYHSDPSSQFEKTLNSVLGNRKGQIDAISNGRFNRVYLSKQPSSFRASVDGDVIRVEMDLIYIENGKSEYRFTPTCEIVLRINERTINNEYGLYMSYINCLQLVDATSGKKKRIKIFGRFSD